MRMNEHAALGRCVGGHLKQFARARNRKSRRQCGAKAAVLCAVPSLVKRESFIQGRARVLIKTRRLIGVHVHQAFADRRADSGWTKRVKHGVGAVHGFHCQDRRRAAKQQLRRAESGCRAKRLLVVRRLERPDARLQPVEQRQVVCHSAKKRLAQMNMCLNEAGKNEHAVGIDRELSFRVFWNAGTDRRDSPIANPNVAFHDVECVVHGHDGAVANEKRHLLVGQWGKWAMGQ